MKISVAQNVAINIKINFISSHRKKTINNSSPCYISTCTCLKVGFYFSFGFFFDPLAVQQHTV